MENKRKTFLLIKEIGKLSLAYQDFLSTQRQYFDGENLYMREAHFVIAIGVGTAPTMSELAEKLEVTPGAVSQLAKRMEQKGFVRRIPSPTDRRVNEIQLTEKGVRLYEQHQQYDEENYEQLGNYFSEYSEEDLDFLVTFQQKMRAVFEQKVENDKNH